MKFNQGLKELYKRTDEVLHYIWDPIGVYDSAYARDEYSSYFPHVFDLLINNKSKKDIADYLLSIESVYLGLTPNPEKINRVVEILFEYKEVIKEKGP